MIIEYTNAKNQPRNKVLRPAYEKNKNMECRMTMPYIMLRVSMTSILDN